MPTSSLRTLLDDAFQKRYGVAAFNIFNDLTIRSAIEAAEAVSSPLILQSSVKTVKLIGAAALGAMFVEMAEQAQVPVALHLDHCPDRAVISECIASGWNSVLFDGSGLSLEDNLRQTAEVVAEASPHGVDVEGEIEGIQGVEDGIGSEHGTDVFPLDAVVDFIERTGITCFAPAIGTSHGVYVDEPKLDSARVTAIVESFPIPIVLHGGTGLSPAQFEDLVARGCAKVNISTALKLSYLEACRDFFEVNPDAGDPMRMFEFLEGRVRATVTAHIELLGGAGRA